MLTLEELEDHLQTTLNAKISGRNRVTEIRQSELDGEFKEALYNYIHDGGIQLNSPASRLNDPN